MTIQTIKNKFYFVLNQKNILSALTILGAMFFLLSACNVKKVKVEKAPPMPIKVKSYSIQSLQDNPILLNDNAAFLWKTEGDLTEQVKTVQLLSAEIDRINKQIKDLEKPLKNLKSQYDQELSHFDDTQKDQWEKLPTLEIRTQNSINSNTQKYNTEKQNLFNEYQNLSQIVVQIDNHQKSIEDEKAKPTPSKEIIDNLQKELGDLTKAKADSLQKIEASKKNLDGFTDKITKANEVLSKIQSDKEGIFKTIYSLHTQIAAEEARIATPKDVLTTQNNENIGKLRDNIDSLESPSKLEILAINNTVQIKLDWVIDPNCSDCLNSFSTEAGTIKNLTYTEEGGVVDFEFEYANNHYTVHIVRSGTTSEEGVASSPVAFGGDFTVKYQNNQTRKKILKLLSGK